MTKAILFVTLLFGCNKKAAIYNDPVPQHDTLTISSEIVQEDRIINIWTPMDYDQSTDSFPVLYMPDGGTKEDFPHIANTVAKLVAEKKIPPIILVGIENTDRRRDLTGPTESDYDRKYVSNPGGSDNFRAFIKEELFTEIDNIYRTTNTKALLGESLAGLFVIETFFLDHNMFDYFIAMDPSIWWNDAKLVDNASDNLSSIDRVNKKLWFAGSDAEDIYKNTRQLETVLQSSSVKGLEWKYSDEPNEQHNTIFRATKEKALIWTFNK